MDEVVIPEGDPGWKCPICYKSGDPLVVKLRQPDRTWVDSGIKRCPNDACMHTFGGALDERIAHVQGVYGYKYFGDYGLDAEQFNAVHDALSMSELAGKLAEALRLILPLAKGYCPEGQTETARTTCRDWIVAAEAALLEAGQP